MRPNLRTIVKGVATMNLSVAFLLVLTTFSSGAVTQGQTPPQRTNQNAVSKPRSETIRICQGLPIPEGYVIIAYMTSSTCSHGAYLLKKQDDYERSLAVNGNEGQTTAELGETSSTSARSIASTAGPSKPLRKSAPTGRTSSDPRATPSQSNGDSATPTVASATASRPRRVGAERSPDEPPTLIGSEPAPAPRPPTLTTPGTASVASLASAPSDAVSAPGPEEVAEGDVVRVNTTLVTVPVSVLDRQGRFVPDLQREDFRIFENGVEQSLAYWEPADKPFTVALLLDTSPSTAFHLWQIKEAAIAFAKQLRPQDRVLIVSFNDQVLLLTEATNDLNVVSEVIQVNANSGDSTRLYDAVNLVINERLNKIKGRKAIVLFTDGVDTSSHLATYQSTLREAEELDALIYPIQYDTSDYLRAMQSAGSITVVTSSSNWPFRRTS